MKDFIKKNWPGFKAFALMCLWLLGLVGGLGWTIANGAWLIAFGVFAIAAMALPTMVRAFRDSMGAPDAEDLSAGSGNDLEDGEYHAKGYKIICKGGVVTDIIKE